MLWFTFPDRPWEIATCYDPAGQLIGYYTNLVRPPEFEAGRFRITDLFLDVWREPDGEPVVLDESEFETAVRAGWLDPADAKLARDALAEVLAREKGGRWPPDPVRRWPLRSVPALRLRRLAPASYFANLLAGRIIAFGLYMFAAFTVTSFVFALLPDSAPGANRATWLAVMGLEAAVLLPLAMAGRLPGTRTAWLLGGRIPGNPVASAAVGPIAVPDERTLFTATLVMGLAVLLIHDRDAWHAPLIAVYGALALFLGIFAVCRLVFEREFPLMAVAGLAVAIGALIVLL